MRSQGTVAIIIVAAATIMMAPMAEAATLVEVAESPPSNCYHPVRSPDGGAMACFRPDGERLYICDANPDGHHPAARWYWSQSSGLFSKHSYLASPNCTVHDLSIPESGWINYQACNYEGDTQLSCGSFSGQVSAHNDPYRYETYYSMFLRGEKRIPYLDTTPYVPQGLTHWPAKDAMIVSYYDDRGGSARIAILDRTTSMHIKTLSFDNSGHAQALASSKSYLWLASTTRDHTGTHREVIRYRWSMLADAAPGSRIERDYSYTLHANSFMEIYGSNMYVGTYDRNSRGTAYRYTLDAEEVPHYDGLSFSVPYRVQGMAITSDHFIWSRSWGRYNDSELTVDLRNGPIVRRVASPNMSQDLATVDGKVYVVYESAAMKYSDADYKVRTIHRGKVSALVP